MHIKHHEPGSYLIQLFTTDLALLALVLRHATENESMLTLTPLMSTTLESLAATFEMGTLITLAQSGHLRLSEEQKLRAEAVQALCQKVVVEGVKARVRVGYETTAGGMEGNTSCPNDASYQGLTP